METLKVKITLKEQLECFTYLDREGKQYIDYDDFTGLAVERRANIDPAKQMLEQFKKQSITQTHDNKSTSTKDQSELNDYLKKISFEDMILFKKERKSTKNLAGGPLVSNALNTVAGQVRKGTSVP